MTVARYWKILFIVFIIVVLFDAFILEPYGLLISVTYVEVEADVDKELTLIHLTDLHIHGYGFREKRVIDIVKSLKPDIIVLTGDYIESRNDLQGFKIFLSQLRKSTGNTTIIAILGNWDFASKEVNKLLKLFKEYNVTVLRNNFKTITIKDSKLVFIGFDSIYNRYPDYTILNKLPNGTRILLVHEPILIPQILKREKNITLALAGHCHGGQVKLFSWYIILPHGCQVYREGLYRVNSTIVYVSRGIGTTGIPARFFTPPEIVVVKLKPWNK